MRHRQTDPIPVAAARSGFSAATGFRLGRDPRLRADDAVGALTRGMNDGADGDLMVLSRGDWSHY